MLGNSLKSSTIVLGRFTDAGFSRLEIALLTRTFQSFHVLVWSGNTLEIAEFVISPPPCVGAWTRVGEEGWGVARDFEWDILKKD